MSSLVDQFFNSSLYMPVLVAAISALGFKYLLDVDDNMDLLKYAGLAGASVFVAQIVGNQIRGMTK